MTLTYLVSFLFLSAMAHEGGEMSVRTGPDQGILERTEKDGFKFSPEAVKRFQIGTIPAPASGTVTIPAPAVMRSLAVVGVYRQRNGFIKLIPIQNYVVRGTSASFTAKDLQAGDLLVVKGVGFVRVIDSSFVGGEGDEEHASEKQSAEEHGAHND